MKSSPLLRWLVTMASTAAANDEAARIMGRPTPPLNEGEIQRRFCEDMHWEWFARVTGRPRPLQ